MLEYFFQALGILFIVIGPLDNAAIYAGLGHNYSKSELKEMALRASIVATCILLGFSLGGHYLLNLVGIKVYSLQLGGGVLLMIVAIQMATQDYEERKVSLNQMHRDISVFPLAMPLMAGPGAITLSTEMMARASGDIFRQGMVVLAILVLMVVSYVLLRLAGYTTKLLGKKGGEILSRILGVLLAILAADLMVNGLRASGLFAN